MFNSVLIKFSIFDFQSRVPRANYTLCRMWTVLFFPLYHFLLLFSNTDDPLHNITFYIVEKLKRVDADSNKSRLRRSRPHPDQSIVTASLRPWRRSTQGECFEFSTLLWVFRFPHWWGQRSNANAREGCCQIAITVIYGKGFGGVGGYYGVRAPSTDGRGGVGSSW